MALDTATHRKQTQAFINENSVSVVVRRTAETDDGAGGTLPGATSSLTAQTVRKVGQAGQPVTRVTDDGRTQTATHVIIAMPTADFQVGDKFLTGSQDNEVIAVENHPEWRIAVHVMEVS